MSYMDFVKKYEGESIEDYLKIYFISYGKRNRKWPGKRRIYRW